MTDADAETPAKPAKPTPEDRAMHRRLAKAMWKVQKGVDLPDDPTKLNELWLTEREAMILQARKVSNQLKRVGVTLVLEKETPAEDAPSA